MPRPKKCRIVKQPPQHLRFKPVGVRASDLDSIVMTLDELEAIRLADYKSMDHTQASEEMEISRSTFTRLLDKAHTKIAQFLIEGKALCVDGGQIHFRDNLFECVNCGHVFSVTIEEDFGKCPECGTITHRDFASGLGHGRCCRGRGRGRNRR